MAPPPPAFANGEPPPPPPLAFANREPPTPPPLAFANREPPPPPPLAFANGEPPPTPPLGFANGEPPTPPPLAFANGEPPTPPPLAFANGEPPTPAATRIWRLTESRRPRRHSQLLTESRQLPFVILSEAERSRADLRCAPRAPLFSWERKPTHSRTKLRDCPQKKRGEGNAFPLLDKTKR